jgi:prolyl-tRNA synthetase
MVHGDDRGLIIPPRVAPIQVVIVPIFKDEDAPRIKEAACEIKSTLEKFSFRVVIDDRNEYTSGWKFNEWELKGVPLRINIGKREIETGNVELVRRDNMNKTHARRDDLHSEVAELLEKIQEKLFLQAKAVLNKSISSASNLEELKSIIDTRGGFVFCGWCQDQNCDIRVKEVCGAAGCFKIS